MAFFSLSLSACSSIPTPFPRPTNPCICCYFLSPSNPPWKLSQPATPLLLQSDAVLSLFRLRALHLLHPPALRYNIGYAAPRWLNRDGREGIRIIAEIDPGVGDDGISDNYLNLPNIISFARMLSVRCLDMSCIYEISRYTTPVNPAYWGTKLRKTRLKCSLTKTVSGHFRQTSARLFKLDGLVARKMQINSLVGSYLDPLAECRQGEAGFVAVVVLCDVALVGGAVHKCTNSFDSVLVEQLA